MAIELEPKHTDALIYRAIAKDELGNFAGAVADLNLANKLDTNDVYVYVERAKSFINMKELEAAEIPLHAWGVGQVREGCQFGALGRGD